MDKKIDQFITRFKAHKEELNKKDKSYSSMGNMAGDSTGPRGTNASSTSSPALNMSEKMHKDGSIQAGIAAAGGGGNNPINSGVVGGMQGAFGKEESKFKEVQHKIEGQGHSAESAAKITAAIGRKEIGQKAMTERSVAARKSDHREQEGVKPTQSTTWVRKGGTGENLRCSEHGQWKVEKAKDANPCQCHDCVQFGLSKHPVDSKKIVSDSEKRPDGRVMPSDNANPKNSKI